MRPLLVRKALFNARGLLLAGIVFPIFPFFLILQEKVSDIGAGSTNNTRNPALWDLALYCKPLVGKFNPLSCSLSHHKCVATRFCCK